MNGWGQIKNGSSSRGEWAKNCKLKYKGVWFNNITIEEMLDGFLASSNTNELGSAYSEYISNWSKKGYQLTEQGENLRKN